jgi:E3 ubiquitin-protein ligase mind-bomb
MTLSQANGAANGITSPTLSSSISSSLMFSVGDKVKVNLSVDQFKAMQEGHGGWNQKMADLIGKIGCIHRVTDKGDIRVQYEGADNRWTICPSALVKVCSFSVGDYVRINSDEETVKNLQKGHGEWTDNMKAILNKICRVTTVYADGDLRVSFNATSYTLNPLCCLSVPKHQADIHNTIAYHNMEDATSEFFLFKFLNN